MPPRRTSITNRGTAAEYVHRYEVVSLSAVNEGRETERLSFAYGIALTIVPEIVPARDVMVRTS